MGTLECPGRERTREFHFPWARKYRATLLGLLFSDGLVFNNVPLDRNTICHKSFPFAVYRMTNLVVACHVISETFRYTSVFMRVDGVAIHEDGVSFVE